MDFELTLGVARVGMGCALVVAIARRAAPVVAAECDRGERVVVVGLLSAWIVTVLVAGLGAVGQLGANRMLLAVAVLFLATRLWLPARPGPLLPPVGPARRLQHGSALFVLPILLYDLGSRLASPPTDWDALTYHLYFPARWLQAERLLHVPTVFGDPAAAFAPQNGALLFTWWMAMLGGDSLVSVVNVLPAFVLALALAGLAIQGGAARESAALVGAAVFWVGPMRSAIFEARVDVPMLAFLGASLLLVARSLDATRRTPWLAAGLATGLAAGTKVVGLVLVGPQALLLALLLLWRRELRACAGFLLACVAGGGWWYVANIVQFGNPLFPLDLSIGSPPLFAGPIPFGVVAGQFHAPFGDLVVRVLPHFYGLAALALTLVGFVALLGSGLVSLLRQSALGRRNKELQVRALVGGVATWSALFYFLLLPHNTETRFLLPVVALALVGWAWLLEPIRNRSPWLLRGAWVLCFAVLCIDVERQPHWRAALLGPLEAGVPLALWVSLGLATVAAFALASNLRARRLRRAATAMGLAGLALVVALGQQFSTESRAAAHRKSRFRDWSPAFEHVDRLDADERKRVAYTGANLPYALVGPGLERPVRYVNTQGALDDGFYDFWRRDPQRATRQKPGFYRGGGRDDYDTWVRNLEAAAIDWVVVLRLHPQERYIAADPQGFPVERAWATAHPERFEPLASGPAFVLYGFRAAG